MSEKRLTLPDFHESKGYLSERDLLPATLHAAYVESYRFHAFVHHRHPFVSYKVLASMVLEGWRLKARSQTPE
jgi:hypothetical protein